jgi:hypothetical protein
MDPEVRVAVVQSFGDAASRTLAQELLYQRALGLFSVLALGLAVVGVFGVVSFRLCPFDQRRDPGRQLLDRRGSGDVRDRIAPDRDAPHDTRAVRRVGGPFLRT